jgi:pseudoazurin
MKGVWTLMAAAALATLPSFGAVAADHKVWMKGSGTQSMDFEPAFLKVAPGDTVVFVPDAAGHNVESIEGIAPRGTAPWVGDLDKEHSVTFTAEGLHGYKCPPHLEMGMVGLIQVGEVDSGVDPTAAVAELPEKARFYMKALLEKAGVAIPE